jgi:hypothetical protein
MRSAPTPEIIAIIAPRDQKEMIIPILPELSTGVKPDFDLSITKTRVCTKELRGLLHYALTYRHSRFWVGPIDVILRKQVYVALGQAALCNGDEDAVAAITRALEEGGLRDI